MLLIQELPTQRLRALKPYSALKSAATLCFDLMFAEMLREAGRAAASQDGSGLSVTAADS